ncbi:uncharacterized protein LOC117790198 [Drosophila innubila]|uniref:uncharacterized protein LOC117790198 n=1 Tax=Drosophila innubila TaxID=198719 RepID=UPI00148B3C10|nr:uncharacterized protein LOC117790198 [Drosophila innubila]
MAEEFPLTDEKLDELFVKDIDSVTRIVEKLPKNDTILATCTRWFQIFQHATHDEKLARNFMLLLMHKQLNDRNTLCYPFTDARSCQRDLRTLHKMSMRLAKGDSIDDDACETCGSIEYSTPSSEATCTTNPRSHLEDDNQHLIQLNSSLARELQALQSEKEQLLQRRQLCLANIKTLHDCSIMYQKEISYIKNIFFCSAITALKMFANAKPSITDRPQYFITLFNVLCENEQDRQQIKQLDEMFGHLLREHIDHNTRETMCQQMSLEFDSLRAKVSKQYKSIIENQQTILLQELRLSGMKDLMLLKKLFMDSFKGDELVKCKVIKFLQREYDGLDKD